jgi:diadenosine tetraphosphate (Ap4A) HIT family hydrolase
MTDCTFCSILRGDLPTSLVFRDSHCAAFMDIHPINAGHVLVVPLSHAAQLSALEAATAGHLMIVAQRIAAALRAVPLRCDGVNLLLADASPPGRRSCTCTCPWSHAKNAAPRHQLESAAAQLRAALERAGTFGV